MGDPGRRRASYDDLRQLPGNLIGEIIDGELFAQPRPSAPHAVASSAIGAELYGAFHTGRRGPGGWVILDEPELHLHGDVIVPDLAGWRRERMPEVPDVAAFTIHPDWVCEVLSPGSEARDRTMKMSVYLRERCTHVWLVQPLAKTLEIYRLDGPSYRLVGSHTGDQPIVAEPFDAVPFDLGALWSR